MTKHPTPTDQETPFGAAMESVRFGDFETLRQRLHHQAQELARSEGRFRDIIEGNADAIVVVDREGVIRYANKRSMELFGTSREALIGSPFGFPLLADERTELDLAGRGTARIAEMRVVESEWDGEIAFIASLRDVTERKQSELMARRLIQEQAARAAAEMAAQRFQFLADSSTVFASSLEPASILSALASLCVPRLADWAVVYGVDDTGQLQRLEVIHRDPAKATVAGQLRDETIDPTAVTPIMTVLRTRKPMMICDTTDEQLASLTQTPRHWQLARELGCSSFMVVPLIARDHAIGAITLVLADADRKFDDQDLALGEDLALRAALAVDNARLYREAQKANRGKSDFLAVISHDLRTPLNAIIGYADLLDMGIPQPLPEGSRHSVQRVRTAGRHLLYLLDELLAHARLEARTEQLRLQDVDLAALAREVVMVIEPLALERELSIRVELPPGPVRVRTDPDKVRQVLLNLIGNALKYTKAGEVVLELSEPNDGSAEIHVSDTGMGIAAEHLEHVFEPFWQVDPSQRVRGNGTGLGLSVVQRLVMLLGGHITVESELGVGSTFCVTLPAGAPPPNGDVTSPEAP
jgi:signal transduction histidine kinase